MNRPTEQNPHLITLGFAGVDGAVCRGFDTGERWNGFIVPLLDRTNLEQLITTMRQEREKGGDGFEHLELVGDTLNVRPENPEDFEPYTIEPKPLVYKGQTFATWDLGAMGWTWDHVGQDAADCLEAIDVALEFAKRINDALSPRQLREVNRRNATPKYSEHDCCATHDFIDANCEMADAFLHFDINPDTSREDVRRVWNDAWAIAKAHQFHVHSIQRAIHEKAS